MNKNSVKRRKSAEQKEERELNRLVSRTGLRGTAKEMAEQYGRGVNEGMHIAYLAVTERLLRAGNTREEIISFLDDLMEKRRIELLLEEAEERQKTAAE